MKISYVIGTHNEDPKCIKTLLEHLLKHKDSVDTLSIVDDYSTNPETVAILAEYVAKVNIHYHALDGNFADQKNYFSELPEVLDADYIFNIDADEVPKDTLLLAAKEILLNNPSVDVFRVPRINIVQGITPEYVKQMNWQINEQGWINYCDYQMRLYKNAPAKIKWVNKVHEVLSGYETIADLPAFDQDGKPDTSYCLLHMKHYDRQREQNEFYNTI